MTQRTSSPEADDALLARFRRFSTPLVSDCAEAAGLGLRALAPGLVPFHAEDLRVIVGFAHTVEVRATTDRVEIDELLRMVDATPRDSMVVVASDTDVRGALWGGLMSTGVHQRGAVGAVVDGGVRDLAQIRPLRFGVFAAYRSPADIRGRAEVVGFGEPVTCRGVPVAPGDVVVADADGVVVVPRSHAIDVAARAEERAGREAATEAALHAGRRAADVYAQHEAF